MPPLAQPTDAHPLSILEIGDSLGEDLGIGLENELGADPLVRVYAEAVGDTGLANLGFYNWPAELESELQQYHPQAVIVFLGANDGQGFDVNGEAVEYGTPAWISAYTARVDTVMDEATAAGARVLWVGMPIMQPAWLVPIVELVNSIYRAQAAVHKGVTYYSSWALFSNAAGQYTEYIAGPGGEQIQLRDDDGIHLDTPGCDRLAQALIAPMDRAWWISIVPPGGVTVGTAPV
jgi:uncharacterized protein